MRIAIFDYRVIARNPAGSCHLALLRAIANEHEFTVFSVEFENPDPKRITWIRVPVPLRPLALLFLAFHIVAPLLYIWQRLVKKRSFDLIQSVESNLSFGELVYAHFSHTTYLKSKCVNSAGLRGWMRWIDHVLHAFVEPFRFKFAKRVVVPSRGLKEELQRDLRLSEGSIEIIANPISVREFERPSGFDRDAFRNGLGIGPSDLTCVFCALGHFERKGLPHLLEALQSPQLGSIKLIVVGGEPDLIRKYRTRTSQARVDSQIEFVGFQPDARPFFWSADAFILPSTYETFSLVAYEAAAASLPLIAPLLSGISDLLVDGKTGFVIEPSAVSVTNSLSRLLQTSSIERLKMGASAKKAASLYSTERFVYGWRSLYQRWPSYRDKEVCLVPNRMPPEY